MTADLEWSQRLNYAVLKEDQYQPRILYLAKILLKQAKKKREKQTFQDKYCIKINTKGSSLGSGKVN